MVLKLDAAISILAYMSIGGTIVFCLVSRQLVSLNAVLRQYSPLCVCMQHPTDNQFQQP